jgi:hypothetical protein
VTPLLYSVDAHLALTPPYPGAPCARAQFWARDAPRPTQAVARHCFQRGQIPQEARRASFPPSSGRAFRRRDGANGKQPSCGCLRKVHGGLNGSAVMTLIAEHNAMACRDRALARKLRKVDALQDLGEWPLAGLATFLENCPEERSFTPRSLNRSSLGISSSWSALVPQFRYGATTMRQRKSITIVAGAAALMIGTIVTRSPTRHWLEPPRVRSDPGPHVER